MARNTVYTKEILLEKSVEYIRKFGIEALNVRDLAKFISCSTQPIFKYYSTLDEFKIDLKEQLHKDYENFINKHLVKEHYLYSISLGYALYAKKEPNIFKALFINDLAGSRTIEEVLNTKRNIPTISAMTKEFKISKEKAEKIYIDVRFYTHGIATQLCIKSININDEEVSKLIENNIAINLKRR